MLVLLSILNKVVCTSENFQGAKVVTWTARYLLICLTLQYGSLNGDDL